MSLPADSETIASGGTIATQILSGKEYQVIMSAGSDGHIVGSRPDYLIYWTPAANAANRILGDIYNTGTVPIRIRGIWIIPTFTTIAGAQIGWSVVKTSAAGTGGTAATPNIMDSGVGGSWPAAATTRSNPTGGATTASTFLETYTINEETNAGFAIMPYQNQLPQLGDRIFEVVLRQNEGLAVKQIVTNTVGLTGVLLLATYDN